MSFFQNLFRKKQKENLNTALYKTKTSVFSKIVHFLKGHQTLDAQTLETLEKFLISADVGVDTTFHLLDKLATEKGHKENPESLLKKEMLTLFTRQFDYTKNIPFPIEKKPYIILIVGINGVGKTTSIGKLVHLYKEMGKDVILGAADTFRAAAIDQLRLLSERTGVSIIKKEPGADPASVAYDTVQSGLAKNKDVIIIDTAGRLHTKNHLMDELSKIKRVIQKILPDSPQEVLLVLDGATGQNALQQVKEFSKSTGITGCIVTKLDGSAKGGMLINLAHNFPFPIRYIGVGEKAEDILIFNPEAYIETLFE